ncbi:FxSxx-COOH system tetratricopeptide repeat protein [Streptomyces sp. NPDC014892]|uniref:FxSxx-COOH system tetratricopeptide repeat protein n=1 Tax=Streptomyces sp. NPDC014892 TaxID=3364930 RepID=UPI0036FFE4F2
MAVARKPAPTAGRQTIIISFAGFNRAWAAWIGDRLTRHGHEVVFQRWDLLPGTSIENALEDLMLADGRILVVLSDWYFQLGPRTYLDWNHALRTVVAENSDRFAAVSITAEALPSAAAVFRPAELWGIGAEEAERRLLRRLGIQPTGVKASDESRSGPRFPDDDPLVWGGVPRRNIRFTGRETLLSDIYHQFQRAPRGAAVCTLFGLSGVGKTQLAAEYVYRFRSEYDMVWWVSADQRGTLRQRLAELAPALDLATGPEYGERLRAVHDALRRGEPHSHWLLVLDGADDPQLVADLVPTGPGHVLITSQNLAWGEHNSELMEVPVYTREESVAFVRRRARRLDPAEADRLAEALGDLPLLLDQTAGWLSDSVMSVDEYVELLDSGSDVEVGLKVAADFPMTFQTAWSILLNRLRETVPESVDLLRLCVFFAPGSIPIGWVRRLPTRELPESLTGLVNDPLRWTEASNKLVQYSVVRRETHESAADDSEILHMHRMVHQTVRDSVPEANREEFSRVVRSALAKADPGQPDDSRQWQRYAELVKHLRSASVLESTDPDVQQLVLNCLAYMTNSGEHGAGLELVGRALTAWRITLGDDHPRVRDLVNQQLSLLLAAGDDAEAARIGRESMARLDAENDPQDLEVLRMADGIAAALRGLGQYEEALTLSDQVLNGYRDLFGDRDPRTLNAMNNRAVSLRILGRYEEALRLDRQTLDGRREVLGPRHRFTMLSEFNYAWTLRLLGRYDEAVSVQERSVQANRRVLGRDHPQTLIAEHNLTMCQYRAGDRLRAKTDMGGTLERLERVLGDGHPWTLIAAANYACAEREHGDLDRARFIGESVVRRYRESLGPAHPYAIGTSVNHALMLRAAGERRDATRLTEECLDAMTAAVGADHPWTLGIALNLAVARNLSDDHEAAEQLSSSTALRAAAVLGPHHPLVLSCRVAHASDLRGLRRQREADKEEGEALEALAATLGSQHVHTVSARSRTHPHWDFEPLAS